MKPTLHLAFKPSTLLWSIYCFLFSTLTVGANPLSIDSTGYYIDLAEAFKKRSEWENAIEKYHQAIRTATKKGKDDQDTSSWRQVINAYTELGLLYNYKLANYEKAIDCYNQMERIGTIQFPKDTSILIEALDEKGWIYGKIGQYQKAIKTEKKGLTLTKQFYGADHPRMIDFLSALGSDFVNIRQLEKALDYYNQALKISEQHPVESFQKGRLYRSLGINYMLMMELEKAETFFQKSKEIVEKEPGKKQRQLELLSLHNFLGDLNYHKKDYESAIEHYQNFLQIYPKLDPNPIQYAIVNHNLAEVYSFYEEDHPNVVYHFKKAITTLENTAPKHKHLGTFYMSLSRALANQKRYEESLFYTDKAAYHIKNAEGGILDEYLLHMNKAEVYKKQNDFSKAIQYYEKAIQSNLIDCGQYDNWKDRIANCPIINRDQMLYLLQNVAELYLSNSEILSEDLKAFELAEANLLLLSEMKTALQEKESLLFFQENSQISFEAAIEVATRLYEVTKEKKYLNKVFQWMEESRNVLFITTLKEQKALVFSDIPDATLAEEAQLRQKIGSLEQNLIEANLRNKPSDTIQQYKSVLFKKNLEYDSLKSVLEKQYQSYYQLKYNAPTGAINLSALQIHLDQNTTFISYFVGNQHLYRLTVDKKNCDLEKFPLTSTLNDKFEKYYTFLAKRQVSKNTANQVRLYAEIAKELHDILIPTTIPDNNKLVIIPDGRLGYLPFEALVTEIKQSEDLNFRDIPYLIQKHAISYIHSATLWIEDASKSQNISYSKSYVGFAPSYHSNAIQSDSSFTPRRSFDKLLFALPGAQEEVKFATQLFKGQAYLGKAASELNFKQSNPNAAIIHLAMHAFTNDEHPMVSRLLFTQTPELEEDGNLNAFEIYNMQLNSQLLVLSACETGYGKIQKGEGILSLARAFKYAGVQSLVTSLWKAEDQATQQIMQEFYLQVKNGESKIDALRNAKLHYLSKSDKITADPFFWANFILIGNNTPVQFQSISKAFWLWSIGLSFLALFLYLSIKRQKN